MIKTGAHEPKQLNILLIEDNPGDARLLDIYLEESFARNYKLTRAEILQAGIDLLKKEIFDIVILDLSLPDSNGIETFNTLHSSDGSAPVIVLTGASDESVGLNAVKLGAQDFLNKNDLSSSILKRAIDYAIERYNLHKELTEHTKKLEASEKKLKEAQRIAHLGSWEWDLETNKISCSDELYVIYNIDPATFDGSIGSFYQKIHPADRDRIISIFENAAKKNKSFTFNHYITREDGKNRDIYGRADVIRTENGKAIKVVGACQDITERKQEQELQKLAMGVTTSFNAVTISDKNGAIEWINEGFTRLSGFSLEDMKDMPQGKNKSTHTCHTLRGPYIKKMLKEKKPLTFECKNYTKSGQEYWVITTLTPIFLSNGEVDKIIAIESDITDRKRIEEELRIAHKVAEDSLKKVNKALEDLKVAKQQVEQASKAKELFLANMSHEIRTPMNGILGLTNILLNTPLNAEQREYLTAIKNSGDTLLVVINDVLDISKMEAGKMSFEEIPFRVSDVTNAVIELLHPKAKEKSVEIIKHIEENVPHVLMGDPARLNQVVMNLMSNAVKFTKKGEIYLTVSLSGETEDTAQVEISVRDTGRGIPKTKLKALFQDFTQASAEISRKFGGTGLGLAISKRLVELQGGTISVDSMVGEGSTFIVRLSYKKCKDESQVAKLLEEDTAEFEHCELINARVLVVEDNAVNQMLAEKLLGDWGCVVEIADNGKIAINKLSKSSFDMVLMDIKMPVMDGYEATRYIREKMEAPVCNIPILAATAHAATWEAEKCIKAGMNAYISKPFDIKELCEKLVRLRGGRTSRPAEKKSRKDESAPLKSKNHYTDLTYLSTISRGSKEFIVKMVNTFMKQAAADIEKIRKNFSEKNWEAISFTAHKMKPAFHFVGIDELKDTLADLERFSREQVQLEQIPELINKINSIFKVSVKELAAELENIHKPKADAT